MANALGFTLIEAGLSAFFSVLIGAYLAHLWMRVHFAGKSICEAVFLLPFFCPPLFVVLAVVRSFGSNGLGLPIYGLSGIVLAHLILNIPLAFYIVLQSWRRVPSESLMLAENIGDVWRLVERPVMMRALPQAFWLIFLYCSLSFTIVLTLGGEPRSTTLEVAIYQAVRYEFDLGLAMQLSALQALIGLIIIYILRRNIEPPPPTLGHIHDLRANASSPRRIINWAVIVIVGLLVLLPLALVFLGGLGALADLNETLPRESFYHAFANSMVLAVIFAVGVIALSAVLVYFKIDRLAWLIAAISPLVLSTLLILALRQFTNPFDWGIYLVLILQILTLSPLFVRLLRESIQMTAPEERYVLENLTRSFWVRLRIFYVPRLFAPLLRIFSIAMALAIGDLALFPMLAPAGFVNLPMLIWQLLSSYQMSAAMALGSLMIVVIAGILVLGMVFARLWEKRYA